MIPADERAFIRFVESLLVRRMQNRGFAIRVPLSTGDRVCFFGNNLSLNLSELPKDLAEDLEYGGNPKGSVGTILPDG